MASNTLLLKPVIFTGVEQLGLGFIFSEDRDEIGKKYTHEQTRI